MPCKRNPQLPTKCTPTSRRMLEGLTIKDLSEAAPDYIRSSHSPHPIPKSGQYANDINDCNPGVSCARCNARSQDSNGTLSLTSEPQTPGQSETCVPTCREVSAMYNDIQQCRHTIGALAKEAQELISTASGILDGCGCDKSLKTKQKNMEGYNESERTGNKNNNGKKICMEKCNEKLVACTSCENAAKKRRNAVPNRNVVMTKKYNTSIYAQRSSYRPMDQKLQMYKARSKAQVIPPNPKIRQKERQVNKPNLKKEKPPEIKNCCQKVCGDDCACDSNETETKTDDDDKKQENKTADTKNGNDGKEANETGSCCDCVKDDVKKSPSNEVVKKQNKGYKIPNKKNSLQKKNVKKAVDTKQSVPADGINYCVKNCKGKVKEEVKEVNKQTAAVVSDIDVDDCSCVREMKKRNKKLGRFVRIWRIIREKDISCDCAKKADGCGCAEDMSSKSSCLKKTGSICSLKKITNKICGKNVTCNCSSKKIDDCRCDENMSNQNSLCKKVRSTCSLDKIRKKVCGKNVTCNCSSKKVDECRCDENIEDQNSLFQKVRSTCSFDNIKKKVCGRNTSCECPSKNVDDCQCDEMEIQNSFIQKPISGACPLAKIKNKVCGNKNSCECTSKIDNCKCDDMDYQSSFIKNVIVDNCSLTKLRQKVCGKVNCECPPETVEKTTTTSEKDTSSVSVAPKVIPNFMFNRAKNKREGRNKSDSKVEPSDISQSAEKSCKCCFPPAYSQYFKCTGQIGGTCQCDKSE